VCSLFCCCSAAQSNSPSLFSPADPVSVAYELLSSSEHVTALRDALHLQGDKGAQLTPTDTIHLAARFIHSRVAVNAASARSLLASAFSQSRVYILRNFPGAFFPPHRSVASLLRKALPVAWRCYDYRGDNRVHYIFKSPVSASSEEHRVAREWWRDVNLLPDLPLHDLGRSTIWNFVSRRAKSLLHVDKADGTCTQWFGKKLWVLVAEEEARAQGIVDLNADPMRNDPAGMHTLSAWLACPSFQWCVLDEGDTLLIPINRLHAVCCIGAEDSISSGIHCWLEGTRSPPSLQSLSPHRLPTLLAAASSSSSPSSAHLPVSSSSHSAAAAAAASSAPTVRSIIACCCAYSDDFSVTVHNDPAVFVGPHDLLLQNDCLASLITKRLRVRSRGSGLHTHTERV
jgi:hypothetical protein